MRRHTVRAAGGRGWRFPSRRRSAWVSTHRSRRSVPPRHLQLAARLPDLRPQGAQGAQMQVDGPRTQLAAAGITDRRFLAARQNRAEKDDRRAHLAHQRVGHDRAVHARCVDHERTVLPVRAAAQVPQNGNGRIHVPQLRTIFDHAGVRAQKRRRQNRQHTVF